MTRAGPRSRRPMASSRGAPKGALLHGPSQRRRRRQRLAHSAARPTRAAAAWRTTTARHGPRIWRSPASTTSPSLPMAASGWGPSSRSAPPLRHHPRGRGGQGGRRSSSHLRPRNRPPAQRQRSRPRRCSPAWSPKVVEPGVHRVVSDGVRDLTDLSWGAPAPSATIVAGHDGEHLARSRQNRLLRLGHPGRPHDPVGR